MYHRDTITLYNAVNDGRPEALTVCICFWPRYPEVYVTYFRISTNRHWPRINESENHLDIPRAEARCGHAGQWCDCDYCRPCSPYYPSVAHRCRVDACYYYYYYCSLSGTRRPCSFFSRYCRRHVPRLFSLQIIVVQKYWRRSKYAHVFRHNNCNMQYRYALSWGELRPAVQF